jgi:GNAT superfamily N-acetyltransferase
MQLQIDLNRSLTGLLGIGPNPIAFAAIMNIRFAQPSDELLIVGVCHRAFFDEDLFGRVIHPHRHEFPEDVKIFWHEAAREAWSNPRNKTVVVTTTDDAQQEKIIGVAFWQRQGDDTGAQKVISEWADPGPWPALPSMSNRALDPSNKDVLQRSAPYTKHYWTGANATNWYLSLCAVDPDASGRGAGRLLVRWGLDRAEEEGIRASVIASENNDAFYLKCGFSEVVGDASEGDGNPLKKVDVKGGSILFMWPKDERHAGGLD